MYYVHYSFLHDKPPQSWTAQNLLSPLTPEGSSGLLCWQLAGLPHRWWSQLSWSWLPLSSDDRGHGTAPCQESSSLVWLVAIRAVAELLKQQERGHTPSVVSFTTSLASSWLLSFWPDTHLAKPRVRVGGNRLSFRVEGVVGTVAISIRHLPNCESILPCVHTHQQFFITTSPIWRPACVLN